MSVVILASYLVGSKAELVKIGELNKYQHAVSGKVFAKDSKTLVIKDFTYDGAGPDAFFWAGTSGKPSTVGIILPYPFEGKFYDYEDDSAPILSGRFDGSKDIVLTLPSDKTVTDLKWLSVWCRRFAVNFGDLTFPSDFSLDDSVEEDTSVKQPKEELPAPPVSNSVDDYDDSSANAEPENQYSSAASLTYSVSLLILSLII